MHWQTWEHFNGKFRKSLANAGLLVNWIDVHRGARFGSGCDRIVREIPHQHKLHTGHMVTKCEGFHKDVCSCRTDSFNPVFLYQPVDGIPSGDSFVYVQDDRNPFSISTRPFKELKSMGMETPRTRPRYVVLVHCSILCHNFAGQ